MNNGAKLKIKLNTITMTKIIFTIFALLIFSFGINVSAQTVVVAPPVQPVKPRPPAPYQRQSKKVTNDSEIPAEKYISTEANVNISLKVCEGNIKINGWQRNEIRAFVKDGSGVGFSVRDKNPQTGKPNLVTILGYDPEKNREAGLEQCLSGGEIELDVPQNAVVNLTGQESNVSVKTIAKVKIETDQGNILLSEIARGANVRTYDGNITIEKSLGQMSLNSTNGNIIVVDTQGNDVGDALTAKTSSGSVIMQQVAQKQIEANSNTGSIKFDGAMENGGQYSFSTINGSINLLVPNDSSCKVEAFYGGRFRSEIPLKTLTEDLQPQVKRIVAVSGTGDAILSLKSISGTINIRKK